MEKRVVKYAIKPWRCVYEWIPCPCKMVQMCILLILQMSKRGCNYTWIQENSCIKVIYFIFSYVYRSLNFFCLFINNFQNQSICNAIPHEHIVKCSQVSLILPHLAWIPWMLTLLVKISISQLPCIMCKVHLPLKYFQKIKDA
jgi:hypothetical protein